MEDLTVWKDYLEKALGFQVEKFELKAGSNLCDGYTCAMFCVDVWNKSDPLKPISLVVKCYPINESRQAFLESGNLFQVELYMYDTVLPALMKFRDSVESTPGVPLPFAPFIFGHYQSPQKRMKSGQEFKPLDNSLVMADLRKEENGAFCLRDRFLGFDLDHYKLVIEAQARFHAVSWAYKCKRGLKSFYEHFPSLDNDLSQTVFPFMDLIKTSIKTNEEIFHDNPKILRGLNHLKNTCESIAGFFFDVDLGQKARGHTKDNILRIPGKIKQNEEPWPVILHGDCWSNNMMFRYDKKTGKPTEVIFIDLQLSHEGDPMNDICYSLFTSAQPDLRRKHLKSMLHVYFDTFAEVCEQFDVPPFPGWGWEEFNRRFRRGCIFGGYMALALTIMLKNVDELENPDDVLEKLDNNGDSSALQNISDYFAGMTKQKNLHPSYKPRVAAVFEDLYDDGII